MWRDQCIAVQPDASLLRYPSFPHLPVHLVDLVLHLDRPKLCTRAIFFSGYFILCSINIVGFDVATL